MKSNPKSNISLRIIPCVAGLLSMFSQGCVDEITPEREIRPHGSFGTELYNIVYDNSAHSKEHSSAQFLGTFDRYRDQFIDAVDTTAVPEELDELNQVFINIVPLYENMLYPTMLRKIGLLIDDLRVNDSALDGIAWLLGGPNLMGNMAEANPMGMIFGYDQFTDISDELLELILKNTTVNHNATNQLLEELSIWTSDLEADMDPDHVSRLAIDRLLTPNDDYLPQTDALPQIVASLDKFGRPRLNDDSGAKSQILDIDLNGIPDTDSLGYYQLSDGTRLNPFGEQQIVTSGFTSASGDVLRYQDVPVFQTFNLQATPLAYLLREADALLKDNTLDDALRATQVLLGNPQAYSDKHGAYVGYDRYSGLAQLLSAVLTTLDHDSVGPNFEAAVELLRNHKDVVAQLLNDFDIILDIIDETPSNFSANNNLVDRLLPELLKIAQEPGLLDDLLTALDDPMAAHIAPILAELASIKKEFISVSPDGAYNKCFQSCDSRHKVGTLERMNCIRACPIDEVIGNKPMAHDWPETPENRSLMQRITNLMWETSGTPYEVKTDQLIVKNINLTLLGRSLGALLTFDNLAEAYLLSITGDLHLEDYISPTFMLLAQYINVNATTIAQLLTYLTENMFGLKLSIDPTTAEVTRMFNMELLSSQNDSYRFDLTTANCRSGFKCLQSNADTLFALEASGLIDALYPIMKVFNHYKKVDIFANILSIVFEYYTTGNMLYTDISGEPLPLQPSDFRSLEPVLIKALDQTNIVSDVGALGDALINIQLSDGTRLSQRFEKFIAYVLTPDPNLKNIRGENYIIDPSGNRVSPISPAYLYVKALRDIADILDANPQTKDQLTHALEGFGKLTINTIRSETGKATFEKPAGIQIIAELLDLLHTMYLNKTNANDRTRWINQDAIPGILDLLSGRLVYAYFQLFRELDNDPEGLEKFRKLVLHLMEADNPAPRRLVGAVYQLMAWSLDQTHLFALARALSPALDPNHAWVTGTYDNMSFIKTVLTTVNAFNQCDPNHVFINICYRLFETDTRERPNILRLFDIGGELFRVNIGSGEKRTAEDHRCLMNFAYDLFMDDERGIERIFDIIDFKIWGTAGRPDDWRDHVSWPVEP